MSAPAEDKRDIAWSSEAGRQARLQALLHDEAMDEYDKSTVTQILRENLVQSPVWVWDEDADRYSAASTLEPLPEEAGTPSFRVWFKLPDRVDLLLGYAVGDGPFYAFTVLVEDDSFSFNLNLPPDALSSLSRLRRKLGQGAEHSLFPLRYEADWTFSDGSRVSGVFLLRDFRSRPELPDLRSSFPPS